MTQLLGVLLLIHFSLLFGCCYGSANVHVTDSLIIDESGRARVYHGANFVVKEFPWYPQELLDEAYVANISQWGFNFARVGYK